MARWIAALSGLVLCLGVGRARSEEPGAGTPDGRVEVAPANLRIGIFYDGHDVEVTAIAPAGAELAFRVSGDDEPLVLKRKGKKYGVLWMNAGEVEFPPLPALYVLRCTKEPQELAPLEARTRLGIGFDALRAELPDDASEARELFGEMVALKKRDDLYASHVGGVEVSTTASGEQQATARLFLPAKTPVGDYTVEVFGFQDGEGELLGSATVHLERGRSVSFLTDLVHEHGLLYGCLAVVIAIIAGLGTGLVFGKGGSH